MSIYYRRHMPHYQPPDAIFHVVFRLHGSLPTSAVLNLKRTLEQKTREASSIQPRSHRKELIDSLREAHFRKFDLCLHKSGSGPHWLAHQSIANTVVEAIHYRDGDQYDLYAFTIMPNHVHLVCKPVGRPDWSTYSLTKILENLKWYTALHCNTILNRSGAFWQHESYDHVIRHDGELHQTIWYVLYNPVTAGLASTWQSWPWSYVKIGLVEDDQSGRPPRYAVQANKYLSHQQKPFCICEPT